MVFRCQLVILCVKEEDCCVQLFLLGKFSYMVVFIGAALSLEQVVDDGLYFQRGFLELLLL